MNEELAATAAWGTQMLGLYDRPQIDGVFSMWYGKGPGLDRSMDALRHANMGGVSKRWMVLAVADDPIGKVLLLHINQSNLLFLQVFQFFIQQM